jgi:hypothetical protein
MKGLNHFCLNLFAADLLKLFMSDAPSCEVAPCRVDKRWTGVLWFGLLFIIMFYFIGASVSVDWGYRSIPFLTALETIRWHKFIEILHEGREVLVIYASTIICVTYTVCSSIKFRLVTMSLGFGFPFFIIGFDFQVGGLIAIAPMMILFMVGGIADGEFYIEGMPQYGAIGLWMWLCLLFMGYQGYLLLRSRYPVACSLEPND